MLPDGLGGKLPHPPGQASHHEARATQRHRQHEAAHAGSSHGGREGYLHSTAEVRRSPVEDVSQEAGALAADREEGRGSSSLGVCQGSPERSS